MMRENEYILQMKNCRKEFPGVIALKDVTLLVKRGEVHALIGENGAGKSTIMKILAGIQTADKGEILLNGEPYVVSNPTDALKKGISMIHQELDLIPDMTVEQNLFAGREKTSKLGVVLQKQLLSEAQKMLDDMNLNIKAKTKVKDLSVAQKQMVAIAKATCFDADIVIMDEPTSAIPDKEVDLLFSIIRRLKEQNKAVIYISHRLEEIFEITDHITVLRDGCLIDSRPTKEMDKKELVKLMVGRDLKDMFVKEFGKQDDNDAGNYTLEVEKLSIKGLFDDISFKVRKGEVLGISGLMGAGRTEVMEAIFGLRKIDSGTIKVHGKNIKINNPRTAIKNGMALITEDRKISGLNLLGSVKTNITLTYMKLICKWNFVLRFKKENEIVKSLIEQLKIKTPTKDMIVNNLSGGNQQKVIIAKWLMGTPDILIMDEPTRGIDVGAKADIYKIINSLALEGKSVIMISSEMPELLGMSDRVIVLCQGKMVGEFDRRDCTQEKLMTCAIGEGGKN